MKISKYKLIVYLIIGIVISLDIIVLNPILRDSYFTDDILDFERNSWKYSIGISLVLFVAFTTYAFKKDKLNRNFIIYNLMSVSLFALFWKRHN